MNRPNETPRMNLRNVQKRENMNFVNQQFNIPYRNWNVYLDGPCTTGLQLDNDVVDYLKTNLLNKNKPKSKDLYILGVRYYMTNRPKPGRTTTNMSLYDLQVGISETCVPSNGEDMLGCAIRGLREEAQIDIKMGEPVHTIVPLDPSKGRFKYIYHIASFLDYDLLKTPINGPNNNGTPQNKKDIRKTCIVLIGELQYLLPILQNFNLNQMSAVKDSIVYPVLFPLHRLTHKNPESFLEVQRNEGTSLKNYIELLYKKNKLFEYPEEIIIPYGAPNFYQLIKFALQNANVPNFVFRNTKSFENRLNMFMKYVEFERLKSLDIKIKKSSQSMRSNLGNYYQSMAQPPPSPPSTPSSTPQRSNRTVLMNPFDLFMNLYKAPSNPFENNPFEKNQSISINQSYPNPFES